VVVVEEVVGVEILPRAWRSPEAVVRGASIMEESSSREDRIDFDSNWRSGCWRTAPTRPVSVCGAMPGGCDII
jgi:hypothetical protein